MERIMGYRGPNFQPSTTRSNWPSSGKFAPMSGHCSVSCLLVPGRDAGGRLDLARRFGHTSGAVGDRECDKETGTMPQKTKPKRPTSALRVSDPPPTSALTTSRRWASAWSLPLCRRVAAQEDRRRRSASPGALCSLRCPGRAGLWPRAAHPPRPRSGLRVQARGLARGASARDGGHAAGPHRQFAHAGTDGLESPEVFRLPEVVRAGGLAALKILGKPPEILWCRRQSSARFESVVGPPAPGGGGDGPA